MPNFKEGQLIKMKEDCNGCEEGKVYPLHWGGRYGREKETLHAWDNTINKGYAGCAHQNKWELVDPWDALKVGDVLENDGHLKKVLGIVGDLVFYSYRYTRIKDIVDTGCYFATKEFLKEEGWEIVEEDDGVEITVDGKTKKISRKSAKALNLI